MCPSRARPVYVTSPMLAPCTVTDADPVPARSHAQDVPDVPVPDAFPRCSHGVSAPSRSRVPVLKAFPRCSQGLPVPKADHGNPGEGLGDTVGTPWAWRKRFETQGSYFFSRHAPGHAHVGSQRVILTTTKHAQRPRCNGHFLCYSKIKGVPDQIGHRGRDGYRVRLERFIKKLYF